MAEILVERRSRAAVPSWAWVGGVAALAVIGVGVVGHRSQAHVGSEAMMREPPAIAAAQAPARVDPVTPMETASQGAVITDVNLYGATADKAALVNRRVEFANVRVTRVIGDRLFTFTSGNGELYAMLDHGLNQGRMENLVTVQPGQVLDVQGVFRVPPTAETAGERLTAEASTALRAQPMYLHVSVIRGSAVH